MSKPVKLMTSPSWLWFVSRKNMNFSVKPVSAAMVAMEKMMIPSRACHGAIFALVELLAFGNMKISIERETNIENLGFVGGAERHAFPEVKQPYENHGEYGYEQQMSKQSCRQRRPGFEAGAALFRHGYRHPKLFSAQIYS
nr:hypothetical protein TSUD_12480 [Ipomoea batatas]